MFGNIAKTPKPYECASDAPGRDSEILEARTWKPEARKPSTIRLSSFNPFSKINRTLSHNISQICDSE
jgi:hypothetical protein